MKHRQGLAHDVVMGMTDAQGRAVVDARLEDERPRPEIQPVGKSRQRQVVAVQHGITLASALGGGRVHGAGRRRDRRPCGPADGAGSGACDGDGPRKKGGGSWPPPSALNESGSFDLPVLGGAGHAPDPSTSNEVSPAAATVRNGHAPIPGNRRGRFMPDRHLISGLGSREIGKSCGRFETDETRPPRPDCAAPCPHPR